MRRLNRVKTSQNLNLNAFKNRQSLFDNYKESLKSLSIKNNESKNHNDRDKEKDKDNLLFNVNEKKYIKPLPPSQLLDL